MMIKNPLQALKTNLSLKLMAIFLVGGLLLSILIGGVTDFGFERLFVSQIRPHFIHYIRQIHQDIGSPPNLQKAKQIAAERPIIIRIFSDKVNWASDGKLVRPQPRRRHEKPFIKRRNIDKERPPGARRVFFDQGNIFILRNSPSHQTYYGLKVRPGRVAWLPIIVGLLVLFALFAFYRLTRRLFSPLKEIQQGVRLIGEGQLGYQIKVNRKDELGELAVRVNKMSLDLAQMMQAKRDMLLALSHELKSPLARSRVSLELLDKSDLQQTLISDQKQIERLIDEVLESERLYSDHALLHRSVTDLPALVHSILTQDLVGADKIETTYKGDLSAVLVDTNKIRRLIRNLLDNALYYHRQERGEIQLSITVQKNDLLIKVVDQGEGIEPKHIKHLTEAFYRADPSRAKNTGGLGLGLYLCKLIAQAHEGRIEINSELGKGTTVLVQIKAG